MTRKGRSSCAPLLFHARRIAAPCLFAELRVSGRYVPSEWNIADAGSRGVRRVGVLQETARKERAWAPIETLRPGAVVPAPGADAMAPRAKPPKRARRAATGDLLQQAVTPATVKVYKDS